MSDARTDPSVEIDRLTEEFADTLLTFSDSSFIREGILKHAVTGLLWDLYEKFPNERHCLADALENWPDLIKDAMANDAKKLSES